MQAFKKHLEIRKINRQIRSLNRELFADEPDPSQLFGSYPIHTSGHSQRGYFKPTEKQEIIRTSINSLLDQRDEIRRTN